jgi:putative N6-adenine-specific DNA methylase
MVIFAGSVAFESAFHRRPSGKRRLWNGPIECELLSYAPAHAES